MKIGNISGLERHNERRNKRFSNGNVDLSRSGKNIHLIDHGNRNYLQIVKDRIAERSNPTGRAVRKDAVVDIDFIISSDADFFKGMSEERIREYFQICTDYLSGFFGNDAVIYSVIHMDETTPHLHLGFVPITKDNRLCAKEIMNRNALFTIQEKLPELLKQKEFAIERGENFSMAEHKTVKKFKSDREKAASEKPSVLAKVKEIEQEQRIGFLEKQLEIARKILMEHGLFPLFQEMIRRIKPGRKHERPEGKRGDFHVTPE